MTGLAAVIPAVSFLWLGMVLAISFLEAPLKFRAPGVDLRVGLGIGRLVFRALNSVEVAWAALLVVAVLIARPSGGAAFTSALAVAALLAQLLAVRPKLTRRSDAVLAGQHPPRSHGHHAYVALEVVKVVALLLTGIWSLTPR